jgi:hydroxyacylglutathione hydrolase
MAYEILIRPALKDNFAVLLHCRQSGLTAAIDAPEAAPYREMLGSRGWTLDAILITHHHADHTQAIGELKTLGTPTVYGPRGEADKIPQIDERVRGGDEIAFGHGRLQVIDVPGHTLGHIAFFEPEGPSLFCGDAQFSLGCGRMFEGEKNSMWEGLTRLRALPDATQVYCGHEYTEANARFALSIDPDNAALKARAEEAAALRARGENTVPFVLGVDKSANPFLRADDPALAARMGLSGAGAADVFAAIRKAKDDFRG